MLNINPTRLLGINAQRSLSADMVLQQGKTKKDMLSSINWKKDMLWLRKRRMSTSDHKQEIGRNLLIS